MASKCEDITNNFDSAFEDMCYLVDRYAPSAAEDLKQAGELETFSRAVEEAKLH